MSERFVVLGSNSFSGSHFVRYLLDQGHEVLGVSRSAEVHEVFRAYMWKPTPGKFEFLQLDINDSSSLTQALNDFSPEVVVNFAAQSMVGQSWENPEHWYQTNVVALARLSRIMQGLPALKRYVHVTTPEVYGSTDGWISESWNFRPSTPYAISRAAGDMHLLAMHESLGLPVCFTRAANVYGPGQQLYRIVPRALLYSRLGRELRLDGGGTSTRSFIHIEDVSSATYLVARQGALGVTYHVSTSEIVSIREVVERACALTEVSIEDLIVEGPERLGKDDTYMLDSSRLRRDLHWQPSVSLEDGMRETLAWVDENLDTLKLMPDSYVHKE